MISLASPSNGSGGLLSTLPSGDIFVGNASNVATAVAPSGDVSMNNAGDFTVTGLQAQHVSAITPLSLQVLTYVGGQWVPATTVPTLPALLDGAVWVGSNTSVATARIPGGDVTMSDTGIFTVKGLQTKAVSATVPTANQILAFVGGVWIPTTITALLNAFIQGGNAFGAQAVFGTTDANSVSIIVNGTQAALISTAFNWTFGAATNITGTTTNNNAVAGNVGETLQTIQNTGTALSSGVSQNIATRSLTAGDWIVSGSVFFSAQTGNVLLTDLIAGISTTSLTFPALPLFSQQAPNLTLLVASNQSISLMAPSQRISLASTTNVFLVAQSKQTAGSPTAYGYLLAQRIR